MINGLGSGKIGIGIAHAQFIAAVDGDKQIISGLIARSAPHIIRQGQEAKTRRDTVIANKRDTQAHLLQRLTNGRQGTNSITIRIDMRDHQDVIGFFQGMPDKRIQVVNYCLAGRRYLRPGYPTL